MLCLTNKFINILSFNKVVLVLYFIMFVDSNIVLYNDNVGSVSCLSKYNDGCYVGNNIRVGYVDNLFSYNNSNNIATLLINSININTNTSIKIKK